MQTLFVYQVGLRRLMRVNLENRTLEEDRFTARFIAAAKEKNKGKLFCETPRKREHYAQAASVPAKNSKALHKLFRETRYQNSPVPPKTPRHKTAKARNSNAPPIISRELMTINYQLKTTTFQQKIGSAI